MSKDSFILYSDQAELFENLSDEQAGKLIKAIFDYAITGKESELSGVLKIAFIPIKQQLDRNEIKWKAVKEKRSEAGKKGMESRWKKVKESQSFITNEYQNITKITDNVNVNVNDNVNVIDNNNNNIDNNNISNNKRNNKRKFVVPKLEQIESYIKEKNLSVNANAFFDYFEEGGWIDSKGNKVKNWKQKLLTWERYSIKSEKDVKNKKFEFERNNENLSQLYDN